MSAMVRSWLRLCVSYSEAAANVAASRPLRAAKSFGNSALDIYGGLGLAMMPECPPRSRFRPTGWILKIFEGRFVPNAHLATDFATIAWTS